MPSRKNNSLERDTRSYIDSVGTTKYESTQEYYARFPNRWARIRCDAVTHYVHYYTRDYIREPAAEMLGTMILILFGNGVDCQVVLGGSTKVVSAPKGDYFSLNTGWAIGEAHPAPAGWS